MIPHSLSILGPGLYDALRLLLNIIVGIGEGSLQGLLWHVLPFTRSVVKGWPLQPFPPACVSPSQFRIQSLLVQAFSLAIGEAARS